MGGVDSLELVTSRRDTSTHDFVGCMRNVVFDGEEMFAAQPRASRDVTEGCARAADTCAEVMCGEGRCVDNWFSVDCQCPSGSEGENCDEGETHNNSIQTPKHLR